MQYNEEKRFLNSPGEGLPGDTAGRRKCGVGVDAVLLLHRARGGIMVSFHPYVCVQGKQ